MPVHFLDVRLSLMDEQQLWWQLIKILVIVGGIVSLDCKVPQRYLVVRAGCGEHSAVGRMPLHRCDWRGVVLEYGNWFTILRTT